MAFAVLVSGDDGPATFDLATQQRTGCGTRAATGRRGSASSAISRSRPRRRGSAPTSPTATTSSRPGSTSCTRSSAAARQARPVDGDYQLNFRNGVPFQYVTYNFPVDPQTDQRLPGVLRHGQLDDGRRVTLNLGLRYANDKGYVPEQCRVAGHLRRGRVLRPDRLPDLELVRSAAARLVRLCSAPAGRSLKAGWARFDHRRLIDPEVLGANANVQTATTYTWRDLNGDSVGRRARSNLDPNGPDFVSRDRVQNLIPNPNELQPKQDEFMASSRARAGAEFRLRVNGIHSIAHQRLPPAEHLPAPRPLQHPDHEPRSGRGRLAEHGRRSGHVLHLLRVLRARSRARSSTESQLVNYGAGQLVHERRFRR